MSNETPAEVLADFKSLIESDEPRGAGSYLIKLARICGRLERSLAAGKVATLPEGYGIEVQHGDEQWMTTAYTLVTPDKRRWSPAPMEPGYYLLAALSAPPADPAKATNPEQVLQLLIAGGFVDAWKVEQARKIIAGCEPSKARGNAPDGWREFVEECAKAAGGEVCGNALSRRAAALLATPPASASDGCGACGNGCNGGPCRVLQDSPPASAPEVTGVPEDDDGQPVGYADWYNTRYFGQSVDTSRDHACESAWRAGYTAALQQEGNSHG